MNYNPFHASSRILHAWGFSNFPDDGTVYHIKAEIKDFQYSILILFLPEFNKVLMTTQIVRIYGPVNIMSR